MAESLQEYIERVTPLCLRFATRYTQVDPAIDPEDLVQECWARLLAAGILDVDKIRGHGLQLKIIQNYAIDLIRRRKFVHPEVIDELERFGSFEHPDEYATVLTIDAFERWFATAEQLVDKPERAEAFQYLVYIASGWTLDAFSALVETPTGTLKSRAWRLRKRFREQTQNPGV